MHRLALLALASSASALLSTEYVEHNHDALWAAFKTTYGRSYSAVDEPPRRAIFKANMLRAAVLHGAEPDAQFGMTKFLDMTEAEFLARHTGYRAPREVVEVAPLYNATELKELGVLGGTLNKDWRKDGAVTAIKDQGRCGGCWAFSAVGAIEGGNFVKGNKKLTSLSEQQLVSCDKQDTGCYGGLPHAGWEWLIANRGGEIVTEEAYPYVSGDGSNPACRDVSGMAVGATVKGWKALSHHEPQMAAYMIENGPISVAVAVNSKWMSYTGGVMGFCHDGHPNHAVLAVGVTDEYWVIKNTWGTSWGEAGYIRLRYNMDQCFISLQPAAPTF